MENYTETASRYRQALNEAYENNVTLDTLRSKYHLTNYPFVPKSLKMTLPFLRTIVYLHSLQYNDTERYNFIRNEYFSDSEAQNKTLFDAFNESKQLVFNEQDAINLLKSKGYKISKLVYQEL